MMDRRSPDRHLPGRADLEIGGPSTFQGIGGEAGCLQLARDFYARVGKDPILKPLFPGKSLRCATEEFAAFLVQFFDGDESRMQYRWWLSLRESHARFQISEDQRASWLGHMKETLDSFSVGQELYAFFEAASRYIVHSEQTGSAPLELANLWQRQLSLDRLMEAIASGNDDEAITFAGQHATRRSVTVGVLARMMETAREPLVGFVLNSLERDLGLAQARYNGRYLIHFASGYGCLPVLVALLAKGGDPNVLDQGGHTPLYRAANECAGEAGPRIVCELVRAGAVVDLSGGVTRSTPLHAAARRGHLAIALALVEAGASLQAQDSKGFTPLDRARNCRKQELADALESVKA